MALYCIALLPDFFDAAINHSIAQIRQQFDYLANIIPPHITLVFPFYWQYSLQLICQELDELANCLAAFEVRLIEPVCENNCVLMPVWEQGKLSNATKPLPCAEISRQLYQRLVLPISHCEKVYSPHITLGRRVTAAQQENCLACARNLKGAVGVVRQLICEQILEDESSRVIYRRELIGN